MNSTGDQLASAPESELWGIVWLRYIAAVGFVILNYDCLLTLDDEIHLVWPGPFSISKGLYYINRYLSIATGFYLNYEIAGFHPPFPVRLSVSLHALISILCAYRVISCQIWVWATGMAYLARVTAGTAILCLRVTALYKGVPWVIWPLWVSFVIFHGARSFIALFGIMAMAMTVEYSIIGKQCLPSKLLKMGPPTSSYLAVLSPTIFDLVLLVLTIVKAFKTTAISGSYPRSPIMRALLRHEVLYFTVITIVRILGGVCVIVFPASLTNLVANAEWGVESTLISRFFLNLRSICYYGQFTTAVSQTAASVAPNTRTHPFWRRRNRLTAGFSVGLGTEPNIYGNLTNRNERDIPHEESVDLDVAMELRTRQDGDIDDMKLAPDVVPRDEK